MLVQEILRIKGNALFTASPGQPLANAIEVMAEGDVGSLVVMENGRMVGMLTFREVLRALAQRSEQIDGVTVGDVMVKKPVVLPPGMETNELRRLMVEQHARYMPVMDGDLLLGVISFLDVAKAVLEEQSFENRMLKSYIKNWPDEAAKA